MKKKNLFMALAALFVLAFASCNNEPEITGPGIDDGDDKPQPTEGIFSWEFSTSFGEFTTQDVLGAESWMIDFETAKMTGFVDYTNKANEDWLISPAITLGEISAAKLKMEYIARYFASLDTDITVWVSENYTEGAPSTAQWTEVKPASALVSGADWTTFSTTEYSLTPYVGKTIRFAIKYVSTDTKAGTIEVKSVKVEEGEASGSGDVEEPASGYLNETFSSDFGAFEVKTIKGNPWKIDFQCATATGYDNASAQTTESESYLVSPAVDLSAASQVYLQFEYILRYVKDGVQNKVLVTDNYTGDPTTTTWNDITSTLVEGVDWTTFSKFSWNVTSDYLGKKDVRIALYYSCTASGSATWEVKNLIMDDGVADENGNEGGETGGNDWVEYPSEKGNVSVLKLNSTVKVVDTQATASANKVVCDFGTFGWENASDVPEVTLEDGTKIVFAQEGGNNAPKFYSATNGVRMYALNTMTITGAAEIAEVIINCDVYNGTNYVGNDMLYATKSGNELKVVNDHTGNSGGVQLRVKTLEITYVQ